MYMPQINTTDINCTFGHEQFLSYNHYFCIPIIQNCDTNNIPVCILAFAAE